MYIEIVEGEELPPNVVVLFTPYIRHQTAIEWLSGECHTVPVHPNPWALLWFASFDFDSLRLVYVSCVSMCRYVGASLFDNFSQPLIARAASVMLG